MSKNLTPQQRVNRLVKDLKTTPYQIGLVYLEELLLKVVENDDVCNDTFMSSGHETDFRNRVVEHIKNNRV